jgi:hypothetical protein
MQEQYNSTFLSKSSSLMALKFILITTPLDTGFTPRLRKSQLHWFLKELETLHLVDGLLRALRRVKDNECLTLRF